MRISDWSSDVCSSDLLVDARGQDEPVAEELTLPREPILAVPRAHREDRRGVEVSGRVFVHLDVATARGGCIGEGDGVAFLVHRHVVEDRKSTRLNSSDYCAHSMPSSA